MGNYEQLKQSVSDVIKTNGNQEITGSILQNVLLTIISTVGANATFAGIATPATNPGTPDGPVFYLASEGGTYTNFNATELQDGLSVLMWNGTWSSQQIFGIDDVPTAGSDNLVKSGGVVDKINELNLHINPLSDNQIVNDAIKEMYTTEDITDVNRTRITKAIPFNGKYVNSIVLARTDKSAITFVNDQYNTQEEALADLKPFYKSNENYCVIDWNKINDTGLVNIVLNHNRVTNLEFNPYIAGYIQWRKLTETKENTNIIDNALFGLLSKTVLGDNDFSVDYSISDGYIDKDGNLISATTWWKTTDFIPVNKYDIIVIDSNITPDLANIISAYDENETYLKDSSFIGVGTVRKTGFQVYLVKNKNVKKIKVSYDTLFGGTPRIRVITQDKIAELENLYNKVDDISIKLSLIHNEFYFRKILFIGDSLTEGDYGSYPEGYMNVHSENYPYFISKMTGAEIYNHGKCGYQSKNWWASEKSKVDTAIDYDAVYIYLGTNDYDLSGDIELIAPGYDYNRYDTGTNLGAYCAIVAWVREQFPSAKIFAINYPIGKRGETWSRNISNQLNTIIEKFNIYLIDMLNKSQFVQNDGRKYRSVGMDEEIKVTGHSNGNLHYNKLGYLTFAYYVMVLTRDIIEKNKEGFDPSKNVYGVTIDKAIKYRENTTPLITDYYYSYNNNTYRYTGEYKYAETWSSDSNYMILANSSEN